MRDEVLLAACDEDLLGKTLSEGELSIEVSERFYGDKKVDKDTFIKQLAAATSANLIGEKVIELAKKAGFIDSIGKREIAICDYDGLKELAEGERKLT